MKAKSYKWTKAPNLHSNKGYTERGAPTLYPLMGMEQEKKHSAVSCQLSPLATQLFCNYSNFLLKRIIYWRWPLPRGGRPRKPCHCLWVGIHQGRQGRESGASLARGPNQNEPTNHSSCPFLCRRATHCPDYSIYAFKAHTVLNLAQSHRYSY